MDENRALDIAIAKALGFRVEKATLYSPGGTLLGGDWHVHSGSQPETPDKIQETWEQYTPRFTTRPDEAFWLLDEINKRYGIQYNLFLENDLRYHTCEVGHWGMDAGDKDHIWSACEATPALAIAKAVAQCPIVMEWPEVLNVGHAKYKKFQRPPLD